MLRLASTQKVTILLEGYDKAKLDFLKALNIKTVYLSELEKKEVTEARIKWISKEKESIKESFGFQELSESVIEELLTENDRLGREVLKQKRMVEYYQNQVFLIQSKMVDYEMKELEEFIKKNEGR